MPIALAFLVAMDEESLFSLSEEGQRGELKRTEENGW